MHIQTSNFQRQGCHAWIFKVLISIYIFLEGKVVYTIYTYHGYYWTRGYYPTAQAWGLYPRTLPFQGYEVTHVLDVLFHGYNHNQPLAKRIFPLLSNTRISKMQRKVSKIIAKHPSSVLLNQDWEKGIHSSAELTREWMTSSQYRHRTIEQETSLSSSTSYPHIHPTTV